MTIDENKYAIMRRHYGYLSFYQEPFRRLKSSCKNVKNTAST